MNAVHIHTEGMYCELCPEHIEEAVRRLPGVKDARAYRSMQMTSVLYNPDVIDPYTIESCIVDEGFIANTLVGGMIR